MATLTGKTLFITGASRGIGLAIGNRAALDGANIVIAAKTTEPHPKLPGTIYTAAMEIERAGGRALPLAVDIRDDAAVEAAVTESVRTFGGIDILVNNASAISLTGTLETTMKRVDLMLDINLRGTYLCSKTCLPHLLESAKAGRSPHILNLCPPLNLNPRWFKGHVAYTIAKYGMSMCVIGMAEEFRTQGIAVNGLWPRTIIDTAALKILPGISGAMGRKPEILADCAYLILTSTGLVRTGNLYIDDELLASVGITDLDRYAAIPGTRDFSRDLFLDS
jgi:citronellol/citronellal dehydrogenase